MKIKTKLQIGTIFAFLISLLIGLVLFYTSMNLSYINGESKRVSEIIQKTSELRAATINYTKNATEKSQIEWQSKYNALFKLMAPDFQTAEGEEILENIRKNHNDLYNLFSVYATANTSMTEKTKSYEERIQSKFDAIFHGAFTLTTITNSEIDAAQRGTNTFIFISIAVMGMLVAFVSYFVRRSIVEPIADLNKGTEIISSGNLAYRISNILDNEIGNLARAFNKMSIKLEQFYLDLENQIKKRTTQLSLKLKELNQTKKSLTKEKSKDEAMLSSIADAMVVVNEKGKIIFVNADFEKMFGWSFIEIKNKAVFDILKFEDEKTDSIPFENTPLNIALKQGRKFINVNRTYYIKKDGRRFIGAISVSPIFVNKKITGVVGLIRDISKEKEIEQMKNQFVSFAAHQLRTPLGVMRWNLEMLLSPDTGLNTDQVRERLEQMYENNMRIIKLVNDLLDVSCLDDGTCKSEAVLTEIKPVINGIISEIKPAMEKMKLTIKTDYIDQIEPEIIVDPSRFRDIIANILSNAVKYNRKNGLIHITCKIVDNKLQIIFEDNGIGIPKKDQDKIFSKFFRASNAIVKETEGTGLGMYMAKSFIERWGGKIWLESEEGKYTRYYLEFKLPN